jgi:CO/xanthine dehydrogenase Mo-binding subunit
VVAVLTAADLPIVASGRARMYEPLAREEVVYAGQPVALVVAETEALAADGVEPVGVELAPLEPVLDLDCAARATGPRRSPQRVKTPRPGVLSRRLARDYRHGRTQTALGLAASTRW